MVQDRAILTM